MKLNPRETVPAIIIIDAKPSRDRQKNAHQTKCHNDTHQNFINCKLIYFADQVEKQQSSTAS
jgi:hypothetical protein